ncbi:MAG: beta-N-acetylhexosaminidase [Xanthomonadaceae bacterium]|nr:beta-N-acetylhexosaminidase [Xanthomonadaceae bacterium]
MANKLASAKDLLGECFIAGFPGKTISPETTEFWKKTKMGGTLIFAHNYDNPEQVLALCNQIQSHRNDLPLWISVDHEGGRVQRFKKGFTLIPKALAIAKTKSVKLDYEISVLTAKELASVGININFTPVADVNTNPDNTVIGDRAYGDDAEIVAEFVSATTRGHLENDVQPCVKHFPGHGDTNTDSHFALPRVDTDAETIRRREFLPFISGFKAGCNLVMTAHMLVPSLDPKNTATMSPKILKDILRGELGFKGLIISDDLEMKAITDHFGEEDSPRLALEAGCDLLIYRSEPATRKAYQALMNFLDKGDLKPEIIIVAAERSMELKRKVLLPYSDAKWEKAKSILATPEHKKLVEQIPAL